MADGARDDPPGKGNGNRWKYPTAGLVIVAMTGLVIYVTVRTGHIPVEVALPLLTGAAAAAWGFRLSDWKGR